MALPVQIVQDLAPVGRKMRRPQHRFQIKQRPWCITPFFIAPVLPAETLKNLLMQCRVVSDPVANPIIGWWQEYYFFYVPFRAMPQSDAITEMLLDTEYDASGLNAAAKTEHYHGGSTIDWVEQCLQAVIPHYFRDEGEAYNVASIGNYYAAKVNIDSWIDSVIGASALEPSVGTEPADDTSIEEDLYRQQYEMMRQLKLTPLSYEDWLATFGVAKRTVEQNKPELVRYLKEWSYPTNTVDPATGTPTSAMSWSIAERADKDRFFREPGFLFGVSVSRPKVYFSSQVGNMSAYLNDAFSWLPAIMRDAPETSLKKFAQGAGPLTNGTDANGYWVDVRDLFIYGDQFVNFSLATADCGLIALPTAGLEKKYPTSAMADLMFAEATANTIRSDGVVSLAILGAQQDMT